MFYSILSQTLSQASLDSFLRPVAKADARAMQPGQTQPQWKITSPQSRLLIRATAEMVIRDAHHINMVEGEGFLRLFAIGEPRLVVPSRTYFAQAC